MSITDNVQLLRDYAECRDEGAFRELVARYADLVYSTALRRVSGDAELARDVTQNVFCDLSRKARSLRGEVMLGGWLHRHTGFVAANMMRSERSRQAREQQAAEMKALHDSPDPHWEQLAPVLDETIDTLDVSDRQAIVLRFFEHRDFRSVGAVMGISDDAAQKRVSRALDKLREHLVRRGVTTTAAALAVALSSNAVSAAPSAFVATLATTSLASAAVGTGTTLTLSNLIAMTKLQAVIVGAIVVAGVATPLVMQNQNQTKLREKDEALQQQSDQLSSLQSDTARLSNLLAQAARPPASSNTDRLELLGLRAEVTRLRSDAQELARLKAATPKASDPTESAAKDWQAKVNLLKQRLEATPGAKIPELQLVTEDDWLNAARGKLDTDAHFRRALSRLRGAGESKVSTMLQTALNRYTRNNNHQFPTDLAQLQPFFDSPLDPAILQRWEIAPASKVKNIGVGSDFIITQRAAVDEVFDTRIVFGANGRGGTDFMQEGIGTTMAPVWEAYRTAHAGASAEDPSELLPYVTTPEQQAALQKMLLRRSAEK